MTEMEKKLVRIMMASPRLYGQSLKQANRILDLIKPATEKLEIVHVACDEIKKLEDQLKDAKEKIRDLETYIRKSTEGR